MNLRQQEGKMMPDRKVEMQEGILSKENDKYVIKSKQTLIYEAIVTVCNLWDYKSNL